MLGFLSKSQPTICVIRLSFVPFTLFLVEMRNREKALEPLSIFFFDCWCWCCCYCCCRVHLIIINTRECSESWWTNLYEYDINQYCSHTWFAPGISYLSNRKYREPVFFFFEKMSNDFSGLFFFIFLFSSTDGIDWWPENEIVRNERKQCCFCFFLHEPGPVCHRHT